MKLKLFLFLIIFPTIIFATIKTEKFPPQCRVSGLRYERGGVLLFAQHTSYPRLYAIENISHRAIWLTHPMIHTGASAGWASQLMPFRWSSIIVTRKNFSLNCHRQLHSGKMIRVDCYHTLHMCQFSQFVYHHPLAGGFWVVENVPHHKLMSHIEKRGFELPKGRSCP